jgi:hypothetical protein
MSDDREAVAALDTEFQAAVKRNDAGPRGWRYAFGQASLPLP